MQHRLLFFFLFLTAGLQAQISEGGLPYALRPDYQALFASEALETLSLEVLDTKTLLQEDAEKINYERFAAPVPADLSMQNAGTWTFLPNGDRIWRCAVQSAGALRLILLFDQFQIPTGARLYAYTPDGHETLGAYTEKSCTPTGDFTIGLLSGDIAILEYYEPAAVQNQGNFHLNRVLAAYNKGNLDAPEDFGDGLACNININCSTGATFQTQKKGVGRILMVFSNGAGWCTGSLIANTAGTPEPYFLTGHHCQLIGTNPSFSQWVFYFDYEASGCSNPPTAPSPQSVLGCTRTSFREETDFLLLKLNPIPNNYGVYFNGWDRSGTTPSKSTFIHHPMGDIKKISRELNPATIFAQTINWGGVFGISPINTHWKIVPDSGIFQPGSSGCPLLDPNKRIVGQLHGGVWNQSDPCIITAAYFGMFNLSWDQGAASSSRLKEWLDPGNTGALTQNGYWQPAPTTFAISGNVQAFWGIPMPNVKVQLSGSSAASTTTDAAGNFSFTGLASGGNFTVTPSRDTLDLNGITTFDLVLITKHLLALTPFDSPWKIIASDANNSASVTTFDVVEIRKVLLNLNNAFPSSTSWRFYPSDTNFSNPNDPYSGTQLSNSISISNLQSNTPNVSFYGVKIGDTNNSADPGQ